MLQNIVNVCYKRFIILCNHCKNGELQVQRSETILYIIVRTEIIINLLKHGKYEWAELDRTREMYANG